MSVIETFTERNEHFAATHFTQGLKIIPSMKTMIVGCVDPRVDPANIFGLQLGEAAILRNVGGRVTPGLLHEMKMLGVVAKAGGGALGPGWNLVVLHHTDCGITRLAQTPDLLGTFFGVDPSKLDALAVGDPHRSVMVDVAALKANPELPGEFLVTGLVYDVKTGRTEVVVPSSSLRG